MGYVTLFLDQRYAVESDGHHNQGLSSADYAEIGSVAQCVGIMYSQQDAYNTEIQKQAQTAIGASIAGTSAGKSTHWLWLFISQHYLSLLEFNWVQAN